MKNSKKRFKSKGVLIGLSLLLTITLIMLAYHFIFQTQQSMTEREQKIHIDDYTRLMSKISKSNTCPGITPVHIWKIKNTNIFLCSGGLVNSSVDGPFILTCSHAFWKTESNNEPCYYYYQILQPFDSTVFPINSLRKLENPKQGTKNVESDVIVCIPGTKRLVPAIDGTERNAVGSPEKMTFRKLDKKPIKSTVTGEMNYDLGIARLENGLVFSVIDYNAFEGESGTIFSGADNCLYILSRVITITSEISKIFDVPTNHEAISLCSVIKINKR